MARFQIRGGSTFESLTSEEIWDLLDKRERERARGVKWHAVALPVFPAVANVVTQGPETGYAWAVRVVSSTLGSAGTLTAYITSDISNTTASSPAAPAQTNRLIAFNSTSQTAQVMQFPSDTCFLRPGDALYLVASTTLTNYYLAGWEVIAEQAWKVAD